MDNCVITSVKPNNNGTLSVTFDKTIDLNNINAIVNNMMQEQLIQSALTDLNQDVAAQIIFNSNLETLINLHSTHPDYQFILNDQHVLQQLSTKFELIESKFLSWEDFLKAYDTTYCTLRTEKYFDIEICAAMAAKDNNHELLDHYINRGAIDYNNMASAAAGAGHQQLMHQLINYGNNNYDSKNFQCGTDVYRGNLKLRDVMDRNIPLEPNGIRCSPWYQAIAIAAAKNGKTEVLSDLFDSYPSHEWYYDEIVEKAGIAGHIDLILNCRFGYDWENNGDLDEDDDYREGIKDEDRYVPDYRCVTLDLSAGKSPELIFKLLDSELDFKRDYNGISSQLVETNNWELLKRLFEHKPHHNWDYNYLVQSAANMYYRELLFSFLEYKPEFNWDYNEIACAIIREVGRSNLLDEKVTRTISSIKKDDKYSLLFQLINMHPEHDWDFSRIISHAVEESNVEIASNLVQRYPDQNWNEIIIVNMMKSGDLFDKFIGITKEFPDYQWDHDTIAAIVVDGDHNNFIQDQSDDEDCNIHDLSKIATLMLKLEDQFDIYSVDESEGLEYDEDFDESE